MSKPAISVIMPVYDSENFLDQAIKSILNQTFKNFELIIINDGSTDKSEAVIKNFIDRRIKYFYFENRGVSSSRNFGITVALGEFIALMDSDDVSDFHRLRKQYEYINSNSEIDAVGCNGFLIDLSNNLIGKINYPEKHNEIYNKMPVEQCVCHASLLMKKSIFNFVDYRSEFEPVEDHQLFLQMLTQGFIFHNIQEYLYYIRSATHFKSSNKSTLQKKISYHLGKEFLLKNSVEQKKISGKNNFFYKLALLEYNNGYMKSSRKNFINYLLFSKNKLFIVFRYIVPSLLGDNIFKFLREKNITSRINYYLKKIRIETHRC